MVLRFLTRPQNRIIGKVRAVARAVLWFALPETEPTNNPSPAAESASTKMTTYVLMKGVMPGKHTTPR